MTYAQHMATLQTPVGTIVIAGTPDAVTSISFAAGQSDALSPTGPADSPVMQAAAQLKAYFDGSLRHFDVPLLPLETERGEALRAAIASIPYGETMTYGALARAHDSGARAVGGACARNPYPIIIPCHRVTSSGGAKENYSAGEGPATKAWLIAHEARHSGKALL
jgi:methylated-DNA-[protein]-cysteine S-methyltransferase